MAEAYGASPQLIALTAVELQTKPLPLLVHLQLDTGPHFSVLTESQEIATLADPVSRLLWSLPEFLSAEPQNIRASRWRLQQILTGQIQSAFANGFGARGMRDGGAGELRFEVGISHSSQVVEGRVNDPGPQCFTVLRGAFEQPLVEIAFGLSGGVLVCRGWPSR